MVTNMVTTTSALRPRSQSPIALPACVAASWDGVMAGRGTPSAHVAFGPIQDVLLTANPQPRTVEGANSATKLTRPPREAPR